MILFYSLLLCFTGLALGQVSCGGSPACVTLPNASRIPQACSLAVSRYESQALYGNYTEHVSLDVGTTISDHGNVACLALYTCTAAYEEFLGHEIKLA